MIKRLMPKSQFVKHAGVLVGGTAGAQVLMVLAAPLLTRLYSPEDFGLLAVYVGLLALFTVVASLRYELAIPLPKSHAEAANIVVLSLIVVLIMTGIAGVIVGLAGRHIAQALNASALAPYFWLLPVGVLLVGCYQVFNYWAIRTKAFSAIAVTRVNQAVGTLAIQILGFKLGGVALLVGQAGGQAVGSVRLVWAALKHPEFTQWHWAGVWQAAKRYKQFPVFSTWGALFNTAGVQLPPLMFAAFFGAAAAGLYALAHRVLALPMSVIGDAVGKVFFSNAAEAHREGNLGPLVEQVHEKLVQIVMPITLLLVVAAPELFAWVFGEQWYKAGTFAQWMAPWLYMVFITSPLSTLFVVMEKENWGMVFQAGLLVVRVLSIAYGAWLNDLLIAVALFSITSAVYWLGFLLWICLKTGNRLAAIIQPTARSVVLSAICLIPCYIGINTPDMPQYFLILCLAVSGALLAVYYYSILKKAYTK